MTATAYGEMTCVRNARAEKWLPDGLTTCRSKDQRREARGCEDPDGIHASWAAANFGTSSSTSFSWSRPRLTAMQETREALLSLFIWGRAGAVKEALIGAAGAGLLSCHGAIS